MAERLRSTTAGHAPVIRSRKELAAVSIGALGVVYGDIGTSPLYAFKECFTAPHGVARTPENILGVLSLIFWSLTLVIVVKYITFIMRADNRGEGGILALLALINERDAKPNRRLQAMIVLGLFGAALLYGDGMITPAISVLSAVEGLGVATHAFDRAIVPITCGILIGVFLVQKRGTAKVGAVFGPATLVWFVCIAAAGIPWIVKRPDVLASVNPVHAVRFFFANKLHGFLVLGSVVLCITGGEALYADMGHFGKAPIRIAWYAIVFPALLLNYFGQGALLLTRGDAVKHTFYELVSGWVLYPLVVIATIATVVASQALISGAYSLTQQAVQLGYSPRVAIVHTSGHAEGQIYVPEVNAILMVACLALVLGFQESGKLAAAYGIAVTGTMSITSILFYAVAVRRWRWSRWKAGSLLLLFLTFDLAFFAANAVKFMHGGWFPVVIAGFIFLMMVTWKRGRAALGAYMRAATLPLELFMEDIERLKPPRVAGTAVFMTSLTGGAPPVLLHHFKHNKVLHEQVVFLSVITSHDPEVADDERVEPKELGHGFWSLTATYGFMEDPDVTHILDLAEARGLKTNRDDVSYFLGRETLLTTGNSGMARWRKALFSFLSRNARPATHFFRIPTNRVVELGIRVEL
jgi:KUP system potassium uptake protein